MLATRSHVWPEKPIEGFEHVWLVDTKIDVWDAATGNKRTELAYKQHAESEDTLSIGKDEFAFTAANKYLLVLRREVGRRFATLKAFDTASGANVWSIQAREFCMAANGRMIAVVQEDAGTGRQTVKIAEVGSWQDLQTMDTRPRTRIISSAFYGLSFSQDGQSLAYVAQKRLRTRRFKRPRYESRVVVWDIPTQTKRSKVAQYNAARAFSPDYREVALSFGDSKTSWIEIWDLRTQKQQCTLRLPEEKFPYRFNRLAFSGDGRTLTAISGHYSTTRLFHWSLNRVITWDIGTRQPLTSFTSEQKWYQAEHYYYPVSYGTPDNFLPQFVLQARAQDGHVAIVELATGREHFTLPHADYDWCGLSPNGKYLAVARSDKFDREWPNRLWSRLESILSGAGRFKTNANQVEIYDIDSGTAFAALNGCTDECVFSPDSVTLATQTTDGTIQLWDLPPRKPLGLILAWSSVPAAMVLLLAWWRGRWTSSIA